MSPARWIIAVVVALAVVGGIFVVTAKDNTPKPTSSTSDTTPENTEEPVVADAPDKTFTAAEVAQHNDRADCWTIINGNVYDITSFIGEHPGGDEILRACGVDASSLFNSRETADGEEVGSGTGHSSTARSELQQLQTGTLAN